MRRIEETSKNRLTFNYGTLYPALLKLEQEGAIGRAGAGFQPALLDFPAYGDGVPR